MKLILMGTPSFAVPIFDKVADAHEIVAVFTRAPKPVGRKQIITKSPVHIWAESRNIEVHTNIKDFKTKDYGLKIIDYALVVAYGVILKDEVLAATKFINIHPSDLPKYRGPSPVQTAIYNGDLDSAVCLMNVAPEVDSGDIFMRRPMTIDINDTTDSVFGKVSEIGADMALEYFRAPEKYPATPQVGEPTFTRKFTGADEIIDWSRTVAQIHNQVRSIGGRTRINGIDCKILKTRVESGELRVEILQPAGKKPMDWKSFMNGQHGKCDIN
jgi:methionyl-tRNA formyltransferase